MLYLGLLNQNKSFLYCYNCQYILDYEILLYQKVSNSEKNDSSSSVDCCEGNQYSVHGESDCFTCGYGAYTNSINTHCFTCSAGYACDGESQDVCPAGTFSQNGASSCTNCGSANQYSSEGSESCLTCPAGNYTNWETAGTTTATECNICPAGYECDGANIENCGSTNKYSAEGSDSCLTCPAGYYTNWDFKPQLVEKYLKAMEELPIDYIEIGYRNLKQSVYKGEFFYTPLETLKKVKSLTSKLIVLII